MIIVELLWLSLFGLLNVRSLNPEDPLLCLKSLILTYYFGLNFSLDVLQTFVQYEDSIEVGTIVGLLLRVLDQIFGHSEDPLPLIAHGTS